MSAPIFSAEFQQRLKLDKYTHWAHNLMEEHLNVILWVVWEFGGRGYVLLDLFEKYPDVCSSSPANSTYVRLQLECVLEISIGARVTSTRGDLVGTIQNSQLVKDLDLMMLEKCR